MTQTTPETPATPPPAAPGDKDSRTLAMLCHLLGIVGILGPLIVWLIKRENPLVDKNGKEAVNFQITVIIAWVAAIVLFCIGLRFLFPLIWLANLVFCIMAAVKVSGGEDYKYPFALRLVK
ncbi:MAG: DUF4870 domain-containing protein [Planctomycetaceae bacterium]|nr:DUF4870 domain-containing protein [Planctomycetaceae bacterium]